MRMWNLKPTLMQRRRTNKARTKHFQETICGEDILDELSAINVISISNQPEVI